MTVTALYDTCGDMAALSYVNIPTLGFSICPVEGAASGLPSSMPEVGVPRARCQSGFMGLAA